MHNPILKGFPEHIEIDGEKIPINTDFKLFLKLLESSKNDNKKEVGLCLFEIMQGYKINNTNVEKIIKEITDFMNIGSLKIDLNEKPTFDYFIDSDVIYTDFKRKDIYDIDLTSAKMHWLEFKMMLHNLPENSSTEKRRQLRSTKPKDVAIQHRQKLAKIQEAYEIPLILSTEQKELVEALGILRKASEGDKL